MRPLLNDHSITIDAVLFDRNSNFVGPISEIIGGWSTQRFVVRSDVLARRRPLKLGDILYYFNCDKIGKADYTDGGSYQGINFVSHDRELERTGTSTVGSALTLKKMISDIRKMKVDQSKERE